MLLNGKIKYWDASLMRWVVQVGFLPLSHDYHIGDSPSEHFWLRHLRPRPQSTPLQAVSEEVPVSGVSYLPSKSILIAGLTQVDVTIDMKVPLRFRCE